MPDVHHYPATALLSQGNDCAEGHASGTSDPTEGPDILTLANAPVL